MAMRFYALFAIALGLSACGDSKKKNSDNKPGNPAALAQIGDSVITVGDFEHRINEQSPYARARLKSADKQKELLDEMVRLEMFAKEAEQRGLQNDPELSRNFKQLLGQRLMKDELAKVRMEDIGESDAKKYYEDHQAVYNQPEQVQVAWIVVKDPATAKRVLADPRIKAPASSDPFHKLVSEFSVDERSKEHGGLLAYFDDAARDYPKDLVAAAFNLANPNDVSAPVKVQNGLAILKLVARKKAVSRQFAEVKQQIRNIMYRDAQEQRKTAFEKELREKLNVKVDESKLSAVHIEGAAEPPPSNVLPPGNSTPMGAVPISKQ
jgi:parvulin-like peptidyl-prolyl isomerase